MKDEGMLVEPLEAGQRFQTLVFTPAGCVDATLAIAACRAGATGILNLELLSSPADYRPQLEMLIQHAGDGDFGLKIDVLDDSVAAMITEAVEAGMPFLIVNEQIAASKSRILRTLLKKGVSILAEVSNREADTKNLEKSVSGVLLKGNESGGLVGEDSSFILSQYWLGRTRLPLYIRGGLTPHVAAACASVGYRGGVLDSQILLLSESPLRELLSPVVSNLVGNETVAAGDGENGRYFRFLQRPGNLAAKELAREASRCAASELDSMCMDRADWREPSKGILPLGQEIGFAASWSRKYGRLATVIAAIDDAVDRNLVAAVGQNALAVDGPMALSLGVELPIVQGPMTRVSDCAQFAGAVSAAGGLPMLALALLRGESLERVLKETSELLGSKSWGIGLLGFAPRDLLDKQIATAQKYKPDYAIIAGGRPDQAASLEASGIPSFLHVPSRNLLSLFIKDGARRFIFEGRECGGHVGPLSSFILWSSVIDCLLEELDKQPALADELMLLFAGGLHDAASSAALQVMLAPLTRRGVKVGILMGSAYLFTEEIVSSGAVVDGFQDEALRCFRTVNLESGPGHASRCAYTDFAKSFFEERQRQLEGDLPPEEVRGVLDSLILGRLRLASKGQMREGKGGELVELDEARQHEDGMYMLGQVATLRNSVISVGDLHEEVTAGAHQKLVSALQNNIEKAVESVESLDIAIVGMAGLLPQANSTEEFWENIVNKVDAITEIPRHRWDWRLYFDADRNVKDKIYSKWGGFIDDLAFDPTSFGMPPKSITSVDPMQLMALEVARRTLADAGYENQPFDRERTSVIIGASGGAGDVGMQYGLRSELPRFNGDLPEGIAEQLPEWSEDTFAGILLNVVAGRIANRLNLGGLNFTIDAACASSLAAVYQGISELILGRSNMVITGGVDTVQGPFGYLCFSQTQALSPRGRCRTFDAEGDGIVISEGLAMLALKRLEDAERDSDRIYCVIKGVGGSSDGKAKGLTAPLPAGQIRAMEGAYRQAGYGPHTVGLFEAHGTGTVAGDTAELESTTSLVRDGGGLPRNAVVGSVKTMIGHTKATAGVAGLMKIALALHYKILPPHLNVDLPNQVLAEPDAPLYLLNEPRPWIRNQKLPRRASVSAFGFGGTNFHVTAEEYSGEYRNWMCSPLMPDWPAELFLWQGHDQAEIKVQLESLSVQLNGDVDLLLRDLSRTVTGSLGAGECRAWLVARNIGELKDRLALLIGGLSEPNGKLPLGMGVSIAGPETGKTAFLFSGQGSQYVDMLRELSVYFPVCNDTFGEADECLAAAFEERFGPGTRLSQFVFPRGAYSAEEKEDASRALTSTDVAQPALGTVSTSLWRLLSRLGLEADMLAGHSYGEFVALHAAGVFDFDALMSLSEARGRLIVDSAGELGSELGTMAAVTADREAVEAVVAEIPDVIVANHNSPLQVIISGSCAGIDSSLAAFAELGVDATRIPVAAAFHSDFVRPAQQGLADVIGRTDWQTMSRPVYSNTLGKIHSDDPSEIKSTMVDHLVKPVEFVTQIESMYEDGARTFIELGPKAVLTRQVGRILDQNPHTAIAVDNAGGGLFGLLSALGELASRGAKIDLNELYAGRDCLECDLDDLAAVRRNAVPSKHTWMINGSGVRPLNEPKKTVGVNLDEQSIPVLQAAGSNVSAEQNNPIRPNPGPRNPGISKKEVRSVRKPSRVSNVPASVMAEYFATMRQFLSTHESVMASYLGASPSESRDGVNPEQLLQSFEPPTSSTTAAIPRRAPQSPRQAPAEEDLPSRADTPAPAIEQPEPVAGPPEPAAEAPASAAETLDRAAIAEMLYATIEETTGYPKDMVGADQNLEGDLGIDSIKRVEIVGGLLQSLPDVYASSIGDDRKELVSVATLNDMLDILEKVDVGSAETVSPFKQAGVDTKTADTRRLPRHIIRGEAEEIPGNIVNRLPSACVVITEDNGGVARALDKALKKLGCQTRLLSVDSLNEKNGLDFIESEEHFGGLIHLAALDAQWLSPDSPGSEFRAELERNELSLFSLLPTMLNKFEDNAQIMAVSGLGGNYMHCADSKASGGLSIQGGGVGLIKSLREEHPHLRYRAVDLDLTLDPSANAGLLLAEFTAVGGRIEVGYPQGQRTIFRNIEQDHHLQFKDHVLSEEPLTILATGGARGITSEVLRPLAKPGNTLIILGRSELRDEPEEFHLLADADALRKHFFTQIRNGESELTPLQVQARVNSIQAMREMQANLRQFTDSGAKVAYFSVDVADEAAMTECMHQITSEHGPVHGVIHGAGIIEDKKAEDKSNASWLRVVGVKLMGLLCLQKLLKTDDLRFFTVFSSVAGRYGNSGQSDYATANELMNRVCQQLQNSWGSEVLVRAFCWGPWGATRYGSGMVTSEVESKFAEKGVFLVEAERGARHFVDELCYACDTVEVISGEGPWESEETRIGQFETTNEAETPEFCTLLGGGRLTVDPKGEQSIEILLDEKHAYLQHHLIDGIPVLPAAVALNMIAESAAAVWPGWIVTEILEGRLIKGVQLDAAQMPLTLRISPAPYGDASGFEVQAQLLSGQAPEQVLHYRANLRLEQCLSAAPLHKSAEHKDETVSAEFAYSEWLFHGPRFQLIEGVFGLSERGSKSRLVATRPAEWLSGAKQEECWLFDPGVIDVAAQMALIWARQYLGKSALPARFERIIRYVDDLPRELDMSFEMKGESVDYKVEADVYFTDRQGKVCMAIEGMHCIASEELNRLGGTAGYGGRPRKMA